MEREGELREGGFRGRGESYYDGREIKGMDWLRSWPREGWFYRKEGKGWWKGEEKISHVGEG